MTPFQEEKAIQLLTWALEIIHKDVEVYNKKEQDIVFQILHFLQELEGEK